jgi:basic amino acid/polyamine antiporter, APA family
MSVNFVTLGLYFSLSVLPFVATGQVIPALIISAIFVSFLAFSYAGLISVMPCAGGDYVWQTRLLTPGIGFVLAVTGWWFILWYWTPVYANILSIEVLQPIAAVFKSPAASTWLASDTGVVVVCVAVTILAGAMVALGIKGYARSRRCPSTSAGGTLVQPSAPHPTVIPGRCGTWSRRVVPCSMESMPARTHQRRNLLSLGQ